MKELYFGTAGIPTCSPKRKTEIGVKTIHELGLGCMEIEFVRGVRMGEATAKQVRSMKEDLDIKLSVHAPYYINLNSKEEEKRIASVNRILKSAEVGLLCGADRVTFHPAFYSGDTPEDCFKNVLKYLEIILDSVSKDIIIAPETTGKISSFGSIDELLIMCKELPGLHLCIDFAHVYTRSIGELNSYKQFYEIIEKAEKAIPGYTENVYFHMSGIEFSDKGERRHLAFSESNFNYKELLKVFKDADLKGIVICESPIIEEDALLIQDYYRSL